MGFDPVSMAVMGAGTGLSMLGSGMQAGQSAKSNARAAAARNAVLTSQNAKLDKFAADNRGDFNSTVATYDPAALTAERNGQAASRSSASDAAIDKAAADSAAIPTGFSQGQGGTFSAGDLAKRMNDRISLARDAGRSEAGLKAYDDNLQSSGLRTTQLGRNIDTTNNYARGTAALTPSLQDFAQYSVTKAPSMVPGLLSGAGSLLTGYGASSLGKGTTPFAGLFSSGTPGVNSAGLGPSATFPNPAPMPRPRPAGF